MRTVTLLYHYVVAQGQDEASGFPGAGPARYKLEYDEFDWHLHALGEATQAPPGDVAEMWSTGQSPAWLLTFDDGGASALRIAETLAKYSWRGHFFITGDRIDEPAFVTKDDIRAIREWARHRLPLVLASRADVTLQLGRARVGMGPQCSNPVRHPRRAGGHGLRPAGYSSKNVARAAASAGIKALFNSEPVTRVHEADGCLVLGRFTLQRGASPEFPAAIAARRVPPRLRQFASWNARKAAKSVGGEAYLRLRRALLSRR